MDAMWEEEMWSEWTHASCRAFGGAAMRESPLRDTACAHCSSPRGRTGSRTTRACATPPDHSDIAPTHMYDTLNWIYWFIRGYSFRGWGVASREDVPWGGKRASVNRWPKRIAKFIFNSIFPIIIFCQCQVGSLRTEGGRRNSLLIPFCPEIGSCAKSWRLNTTPTFLVLGLSAVQLADETFSMEANYESWIWRGEWG